MHVVFRRHVRYLAQSSYVLNIPEKVTESRWHQPWSEPVRRKPFFFNQRHFGYLFFPPPVPSFGYFQPWSKHPGPKSGLLRDLQLAFAGPPRHLPTPNVTGTFSATEINADIFSGAVDVFLNLPPVSAKVSIVEIPIEDSAAASIAES